MRSIRAQSTRKSGNDGKPDNKPDAGQTLVEKETSEVGGVSLITVI